MKKIEKLYFILTYMFFIYPPFIMGLVNIYQSDRFEDSEHITSLIVNLVLILVIVGVLGLLIKYKKLHFPNNLEIKYLLFGLIGNIVMYFYTFQNIMNIDNIVTIYLVLLIVLAADYYLISKKIRVKELWILLSLFIVVDYLHLILTGCGFTDNWSCNVNHSYDWFVIILYSITALTVLAYYSYRILSYKVFDFFKILHIIFTVILAYAFANESIMDTNFILTVFIFMPFFVVVDFIVSFVNKTYTHKTLFFYIRMLTILGMFGVLGAFEFYEGVVDVNILVFMVTTTYVSLGIAVLKPILKVDLKADTPIRALRQAFSGVTIINCDNTHKEMIKTEYSQIHSNHISLDEGTYSLVALKDEKIIGFISTYTKDLPTPLEDVKEAYINILEVKEEFRNQGIGTRLIEKTERYFAKYNISQIRGWSSDDKVEAIKLWNELKYSMSPATIWIEKKKVSVKGSFFVKKLKK